MSDPQLIQGMLKPVSNTIAARQRSNVHHSVDDAADETDAPLLLLV